MVIKISEGAEALIYGVQILGLEAVVKYRTRKRYRIEVMDNEIRLTRTKKEARIMSAALAAEVRVPSVFFVDEYSVCMSRISGRVMSTMMGSKKLNGNVFSRLGTYAARMHNVGIAHGDYTPANVMIDTKGMPWIIDFGLSEMTSALEDKALDLLLMKRSINLSQFRAFTNEYTKQGRDASEVMRRLSEIEKRGRYQKRTLLSEDDALD